MTDTRAWSAVAGACLVGALVGLASGAEAYVIGGVLAGVLLALGVRTAYTAGVTERRQHSDTARQIRLLVLAWMALMFVNNHRLTIGEGPAGAIRSPFQFVIDVGVNFSIGVLVVVLLGWRRGALGDGRLSNAVIALFVFPIWTLATLVWGTTLVTGLFRGSQLVLTALLATATLAILRESRDAIDLFISTLLRWYAWTVMALVALGYTIGPVYASIGAANRGRYTWPAAHPGVTGLFLAPAIVILLAAPRDVLRMPLYLRVPAIGVASVALYQNHARTAVLAALLAALFVLWYAGRRQPIWRVLGLPYLFGAALIVLLYYFQDVVDFALRGGTTQNLVSLQGRTQLWPIAAEALATLPRWLVGLGHGATSYVFIEDVAFAGTAHSTPLALIVNNGIIGLAMVLVLLAWPAVGLLRHMVPRVPGLGIPLLGILLTLVVQAATSDALAEPNFGFAFLYVCIVVVVAERSLPAPAGTEAALPDAVPQRSARALTARSRHRSMNRSRS